MQAALPLIGHRDLAQPVAWYRDGAISAARFLSDAYALAARLPSRRHVLNLCDDRYHFMVTFGAALINRQTCVLPPNHAERVLAQVREACGDHVCVGDGAEPTDEHALRFPADLQVDFREHAVPFIEADHVAAIVFTSGSTGVPRPNQKAWGRLVAGAHSEAHALGLSEGEIHHFVGTVPPQHMYGLESTVLLPMQIGGAAHAGRPLFARDVETCLAQLPGKRVLITTPIHIRACLEDLVKLPELHRVVSAAAPLSRELAIACEQRYGAELREIYGFTEAGMLATRRTATDLAWQLMSGIHIVREGESWSVHGGHVNGRLPFSDLIEVISPREFHLQGRSQDIVNVAGKRASLGDLNQKLNEIPGVKDGVFHIRRADDRRVERLMAFVVAPDLSESDLIDALRHAIDPAFLPRPLVKVDILPRTASGKLPLDRLREMEVAACEQ